MNPAGLLERARAAGMLLWVDDGRLRYRAQPGTLDPQLLELLRANRDALRVEIERQAAIRVVDRTTAISASAAQERLWALEQLGPGQANLPLSLRLRGPLDVEAMERAIDALVARHEAFRTSFARIDERLQQRIDAIRPLIVARRDISHSSNVEARVRQLVEDAALAPFDLATAPLFRANLFVLGVDDHVLLLVTHHIVSDDESMRIVTRELAALYEAVREDNPSPLKELPFQHVDYVAWQARRLAGGELQRQLAYWRNALAEAPGLELPTSHARPSVRAHRGAGIAFDLPASVHAKLDTFGRRAGVTSFMTLLAAFKVLLARYTCQRDVVVGTPCRNRSSDATKDIVGAFANTLALRTAVHYNATFLELVSRVKEATLAADAQQEVSVEDVVEAGKVEHLVPVTFSLHPTSAYAPMHVGLLRIEPMRSDVPAQRFELSLTMFEGEGTLSGWLGYDANLFDRESAAQFTARYCKLLDAIAAAPERSIEEYPVFRERTVELGRSLPAPSAATPPIRAYPHHAYAASFVGSDGPRWDAFYAAHFINLHARLEGAESAKDAGLGFVDFSPFMSLNHCAHMGLTEEVEWNAAEWPDWDNDQICKRLVEALADGWCLEVILNERYCERTSSWLRHGFRHIGLISSYHQQRNCFESFGYRRGGDFGELVVPAWLIKRALVSHEGRVETYARQNLVRQLRATRDEPPPVDVDAIVEQLEDFLASRESMHRYGPSARRRVESGAFGMDVLRLWAQHVARSLDEKRAVDFRVSRLLWERAKLMDLRIERLATLGLIADSDSLKDTVNRLARVWHKSHVALFELARSKEALGPDVQRRLIADVENACELERGAAFALLSALAKSR